MLSARPGNSKLAIISHIMRTFLGCGLREHKSCILFGAASIRVFYFRIRKGQENVFLKYLYLKYSLSLSYVHVQLNEYNYYIVMLYASC